AVPVDGPSLHLTVGVKRAGAQAAIKPRPSFGLPWSATIDRLPPGRDFLIGLRPVLITSRPGDDTMPLELEHRGHTYRSPRAMRAIVESLDDSPRSFRALAEAVADRLDESSARLLLAMLAKDGLITTSA